MAADYTDGGGWAKLDQTAAQELASVISTFTKRTVAKYTLLLLTLYRSMDADGRITAGYESMSKMTGIPIRTVRRFIEDMESQGVLVRIGSYKRKGGGSFIVRRFSWIECDRMPQKWHTGMPQNPGKVAGRYATNQGKTGIQQNSTEFSEGGGGSATAMPPPQDVTDVPRWPSVMGGAPGACADRR